MQPVKPDKPSSVQKQFILMKHISRPILIRKKMKKLHMGDPRQGRIAFRMPPADLQKVTS
jgi:hypothetical protein